MILFDVTNILLLSGAVLTSMWMLVKSVGHRVLSGSLLVLLITALIFYILHMFMNNKVMLPLSILLLLVTFVMSMTAVFRLNTEKGRYQALLTSFLLLVVISVLVYDTFFYGKKKDDNPSPVVKPVRTRLSTGEQPQIQQLTLRHRAVPTAAEPSTAAEPLQDTYTVGQPVIQEQQFYMH